MKKILVILLAMFAFGIQIISAQDEPMTISCSSPDLGVKANRCVAAGKNVIIDLLLTNKGDKDIERYHATSAKVYDSEGNSYEGETYSTSKINIKVPGNDKYLKMGSIDCVYATFDMPVDIPRKVSMSVENVDKAASSFLKFELNLGPYAGSAETFIIEIRNIPITRN